MYADHSFTSALGGDGWYRTQQRSASGTQDTVFAGLPADASHGYGGGEASMGQLTAALLAALIVGYMLFAFWTRKHSL